MIDGYPAALAPEYTDQDKNTFLLLRHMVDMRMIVPEAVTMASYCQAWQSKSLCWEKTTASFRQLRRYADDRHAIQERLIITNPSQKVNPQQVIPYPYTTKRKRSSLSHRKYCNACQRQHVQR